MNDRAAVVASSLLVALGAWWFWRRPEDQAAGGGGFDVFSAVDQAISGVADQIVTTTGGMLARVGDGRMNISVNGMDAIKAHEALRLTKYRDQAGKWTIGYGHLILPWENFDAGITEQEALGLLVSDLADAEAEVNARVRVSISQAMYDALVSLAFNIGAGAFAGSTVVRRLNQGDFAGAADAILMWNKVTINGQLQPSAGLTARREDERRRFLSGVA